MEIISSITSFDAVALSALSGFIILFVQYIKQLVPDNQWRRYAIVLFVFIFASLLVYLISTTNNIQIVRQENLWYSIVLFAMTQLGYQTMKAPTVQKIRVEQIKENNGMTIDQTVTVPLSHKTQL